MDFRKRYCRAIAVTVASAAALAFWWWLSQRLQFEFHSDTGIVAWVSVNQYPKQQEVFYFLLVVVGTPLVAWMAGRLCPTVTIPAAAIETSRRSRVRRILAGIVMYVLCPVVIYALHYSRNIDHGIDLFHEGEFLVPLNEMLSGGMPYRDIYLQHGLFHNALIPLLGGELFGPTLAGVRTMHALLNPLPYVALYFWGLFMFRGKVVTALLLAGVFLSESLEIPIRTTLPLASLAMVAMWLTKPQITRWPLIVAGGLAGLAVWHSVEVGLYAIAAIGVFLIAASMAQRQWLVLPFVIGVMAGFWLIGWYFVWQGVFGDVLRNFYIQCAYQVETWGLPFPSLSKIESNTLRWYYAPIAGFTVAVIYLAYRADGKTFWRSRVGAHLLLIVIASVVFFRTVLGRSDWHHLYYSAMFAVLLAFFWVDHLWHAAWQRFRQRRWWVIPWVVGAVVVTWSMGWYIHTTFKPWEGLHVAWKRLANPPPVTVATTETLERAGVVDITVGQAEQIRQVATYLQAHTTADARVFDFSNQAGYLFFAKRRSASRYFQAAYASLPAMQQEVIADLERYRVPLVIANSGTGYGSLDGVPSAKRHPLIAQYLAEHYESAETIAGRVEIWKRKENL